MIVVARASVFQANRRQQGDIDDLRAPVQLRTIFSSRTVSMSRCPTGGHPVEARCARSSALRLHTRVYASVSAHEHELARTCAGAHLSRATDHAEERDARQNCGPGDR